MGAKIVRKQKCIGWYLLTTRMYSLE